MSEEADPAPGAPWAELETPALLVDLDVLEENVSEMAALCRGAGVALRPHWKTHKCPEIARRQIGAGAVGGTVAKPAEALAFLGAGFHDLLIATPVVDPRKMDRVLAAAPDGGIAALVESGEGARLWAEAAARAGRTLDVMLEIDTGMGRTGLPPGSAAVSAAQGIAALPGLSLRGVMTHAGHAYGAPSAEEIARIGREEGEALVQTAEAIRAAGLECPVVSVGSTPTVRHSALVAGVTEARPGNYVFHDAIQVALGVVGEERCALTVLATVVARPTPERVIVDAGAKTLAADRAPGEGSAPHGRVLGRPALRMARVWEEHGLVEGKGSDDIRVGDRVRVIPNHACPVVNLHERLVAVRGEGVESVWTVTARGKVG